MLLKMAVDGGAEDGVVDEVDGGRRGIKNELTREEGEGAVEVEGQREGEKARRREGEEEKETRIDNAPTRHTGD